MTLGIGNNIAKLKETWNAETKRSEVAAPPQVVENEAYHQFEIKALYGNQGDPGGFVAVLKLVK